MAAYDLLTHDEAVPGVGPVVFYIADTTPFEAVEARHDAVMDAAALFVQARLADGTLSPNSQGCVLVDFVHHPGQICVMGLGLPEDECIDMASRYLMARADGFVYPAASFSANPPYGRLP